MTPTAGITHRASGNDLRTSSSTVVGHLETVIDTSMEHCAAWVFNVDSRDRMKLAFKAHGIQLCERVVERVNKHYMVERSVYDLNIPGLKKREFLAKWIWKWGEYASEAAASAALSPPPPYPAPPRK